MSKDTHTALKEVASALAEYEGIPYTRARRIVERWAVHQGPTDAELEAADGLEFDPVMWYAMQPGSEIPGFVMERPEYPVPLPGPATGCYPLTVPSLADPERHAVLSLACRPAALHNALESEPVLIVEPFGWTGAGPGFGLWAVAWSGQLHERGLDFRIGALAVGGWTAIITPRTEVSAPCRVRIAHRDGYVMIDMETPLPPDWLARVRQHPEGMPVLCGPCAGARVPDGFVVDVEDIDVLLETADLIAARIPFTVRGA